MGEMDRPERYRTIRRGLLKLGLEMGHGSKHDVFTVPKTGRKTNLPRHSHIKKSVVGSICDFLIENGYDKPSIFKAFRWK